MSRICRALFDRTRQSDFILPFDPFRPAHPSDRCGGGLRGERSVSLISPTLIGILRERFALDWRGIHGAGHWARVRANGLRLAARTGADPRVVEYFAFLHDVCRQDDERDPWHGYRASEFAKTLGRHLALDSQALEELLTACALHSEGYTQGFSSSILTCWDADRLDLGRVFIRPDPRYLCTDAAREPDMLAWAYGRSVGEC